MALHFSRASPLPGAAPGNLGAGRVPGRTCAVWLYGGQLRHDALGAALLLERGMVRAWFQGERPSAHIALRTWIYAACGHYGSPPDLSKARASLRSCFSERNIADAEAFVAWARGTLGPARMPVFDEAAARRASPLLAGLISVVDWIGSKQEWFPFAPDATDPAAYLDVARQRADHAVTRAGVVPRPPVTVPTFAGLYPEITHPSPMQSTVDALGFDG